MTTADDAPSGSETNDHTIPAPEGTDGYSLQNPPDDWKFAGPEWHRVEQMKPVHAPQPVERVPQRKVTGSVAGLAGCNAIVFVVSVCVMVLELTATRLISKHVGSSLYTWTSVIGVVLAGITLGNFLGGWLADRFPLKKLLAWLSLLSSASCLSVLWLDTLVAGRSRPADVEWPTWVFLTVAQMFLLPALALGTISPVVASLALKHGRRTGATVGNVYAWGAMGSIVGTFLTGFWLIDLFGTRAIVGGTSAVLALLSVLVASRQILFRTAVVLGWMQFLLLTTSAAAATRDTGGAIGERFARMLADRDAAVESLADWYGNDREPRLEDECREKLLSRVRGGQSPGLDKKSALALEQWLTSGRRQHLDEASRSAIEAFIDTSRVDSEEQWRYRAWGEQFGLKLHELGLLLYLRGDRTDEYHDESSYQYVNVSTTEEDGDPVRQLRLDKLVHSYFNPDDPARLYYEYEQVYAEVTERVLRTLDRSATAPLTPFNGLSELPARLPEWAAVDDPDQREPTLRIRGVLTEDRRRDLLRLSDHGDYWLTLEQVAEMTRQPDWAGFSSVTLQALPDLAGDEKFFQDRLTFEPAFRSLNAFRMLSEEDVRTLSGLGDAGSDSSWRDAVNLLATESRRVSTFFIGGGGFVFPRWIRQQFPGDSRIVVAELDPAVQLAVQREMGLAPESESGIATRIGDARNVVDDLLKENARRAQSGEGTQQFDFVYGDAFNDFSVPWHLTTLEFNRKVRDLLAPDAGVYLINVIDTWPRTRLTLQPEATLPAGLVTELESAGVSENEVTGDWQFAPDGFPGLEFLLRVDNGLELAVRGVPSQSLIDRLLSFSTGEADPFRQSVENMRQSALQVGKGRFLASCTATLAEVYPNLYVFSTAEGPPSNVRDTFVIVASMKPIHLTDLHATGTHWSVPPFALRQASSAMEVATAGQMDALLATARGLILTDDFAPVDNLLRPVFEDQD